VGGFTIGSWTVRWNAPGEFKTLRRKRDKAVRWIRRHRDEVLNEMIIAALKVGGKALAVWAIEALVASVVASSKERSHSVAAAMASDTVSRQHASELFRAIAREEHGEEVPEEVASSAVLTAIRTAQKRCVQMYVPRGRG